MTAQYDLVAEAISYLSERAPAQPSLDDLASNLGVSAFHLQRTFRKYAGVTPKQFLAALTLDRAKTLLAAEASVLHATLESGLSSPARLHDHFITLEAMTPGEYKRAGSGLTVRWGTGPTPFGHAVVGTTDRGICALEFLDGCSGEELLRERLPNATLARDDKLAAPILEAAFSRQGIPVHLHVSGTNFQVRVWNALLNLTEDASVTSYSHLAEAIGQASSARAVGNAVGANPIAVLIPCHRVLARTGIVGNYRWGSNRKRALLAWEQARADSA